jgi:hypothetical protein
MPVAIFLAGLGMQVSYRGTGEEYLNALATNNGDLDLQYGNSS